jgi:hypothetical protein
MEAKRRALDEIAADEKRKDDAERREQAMAGPSSSGGSAIGRRGPGAPIA